MSDEKNEKPATDAHKKHDEPVVDSKDEKHEPKSAEVVTKDEKPAGAPNAPNAAEVKMPVQTTGFAVPIGGTQAPAPVKPPLKVVIPSTPPPPLKPAPYEPDPAKSYFSLPTAVVAGTAIGTVIYAVLHYALHVL